MPKCVVWIFLLAKRITVHNLSALFSGKLKTLFIITGERLFWDWGEISTAKYCICIYDIVLPYYNKCLNLIFAFTYNAESFTIVFFIFLFCLLHLFWDGLVKVLCVFRVLCLKTRVISLRLISLDSWKKVYVENIRVREHDVSCALEEIVKVEVREHLKSYSSTTKYIISTLPQYLRPPWGFSIKSWGPLIKWFCKIT